MLILMLTTQFNAFFVFSLMLFFWHHNLKKKKKKKETPDHLLLTTGSCHGSAKHGCNDGTWDKSESFVVFHTLSL